VRTRIARTLRSPSSRIRMFAEPIVVTV